jgi:mRNA interferase RelE/StbE
MKVAFVKSAEKELLSLNKTLAQRILEKITLLEIDPHGQGSQKLAGGKGYRIRIGDYRIVYTINNTSKIITIIKIGHRREVYK